MLFKFGDVLLWKKFQHRKYGEVKDRWFLCIGRNSKYYILLTTTTQKKQSSSSRIYFHKNSDTCFKEDCSTDISDDHYVLRSPEVSQSFKNSMIEYKGRLKENKKNEIYKKIKKSHVFSKEQLKIIEKNFKPG